MLFLNHRYTPKLYISLATIQIYKRIVVWYKFLNFFRHSKFSLRSFEVWKIFGYLLYSFTIKMYKMQRKNRSSDFLTIMRLFCQQEWLVFVASGNLLLQKQTKFCTIVINKIITGF